MPWLLVPILPLFLFSAQIFASVSVYLSYLLIPVAAYLGRRFGVAGLATVALGGILALGPVISISWLSFGGGFAVYVISLCVSWAATQPVPLVALADDGSHWCRPAWFAVLLMLLPLSINFPWWELGDGVAAAFRLSLLPLLILTLFLAGRAGLEAKVALAGLVIATAIGVLLHALELDTAISSMLGGTESFLRYQLDDLATLVTAITAFLAGRAFANPSHPGNPWDDYPYLVAGLLVVLSQLPSLGGQFLPELPPVAGYLGIHGQYLALPLAAFMIGIHRGYAGLGYVVGLTLAIMLAGNLASVYLTDRGLWLDLEQPFIALAFAWLGIRLADLMLERSRPWPGGRWYLYAGLVLLFLPALFSLDELLGLLLPFATALAAALFAALMARIRQRLALAGITLTGEGWLKLALVLAVVIIALAHIGQILDAILDVAWQYDLPPEIALPAIILLLHLPLAFLARLLADIWPKIAGDLRNIAAYWRGA